MDLKENLYAFDTSINLDEIFIINICSKTAQPSKKKQYILTNIIVQLKDFLLAIKQTALLIKCLNFLMNMKQITLKSDRQDPARH